MILMTNKILSSVLEILLFGLVPFIWWLATARKSVSFTEWIGLKKSGSVNKKEILAGIICTVLLFVGLTVMTSFLVKDADTATAEFRGLGIAGLPAALIWAICNTALPEELLFRGFLQKRLSSRFGYLAANIIQSMLFGLMHCVFFFTAIGTIKAIMLIAYTGLIAFVMAYINEKKAAGSIFPSWAIHACANIVASIFSLFSAF